jgi:hypothetical protein
VLGNQPSNYFLTASYPKDARTWVSGAKEHIGSSAVGGIEVYLIAICDPDDECDVRVFSEKSGADPFPHVTATVPGDYILTGGGAQASEGSFLVASFPGGPNSWVAVSKTPIAGNTASVTAYAIGIRASDRAQRSIGEIFGRKMFETITLANEGASATCPSAEISIPSGYVLTGGGAVVNGMGDNFLQVSLPYQNKKWEVSSKELRSGACTITACAIGARVGSGTL